MDAVGTPDIRPRLIIGLGNPGENYKDTRHNIGFMVLDEAARRLGLSFQSDKRWNVLSARQGNTWFAKPQTYMNDSGRAAGGICKFFKIEPQEALVIYDDVDLPLGAMRIRAKGSAAGHNGIKSLIHHLGTDEFPRIKVGIAACSGRPDGDRMVGHVLGKFSGQEEASVAQIISRAADAVIHSLNHGLSATMNLFNRK